MTARAQAPADGGPRIGPAEDAVPAGLRQAALLLHTLADADREWLVERLPERDRAALRPLLSELRALGIPADRSLVEATVAGGRAVQGAEGGGRSFAEGEGAAGTDAGLVELLERTEPARLAFHLRDEPPGLVAKLLALHPWPWRDALLAALRPSVARDVEEALARRQADRSAAGAGGDVTIPPLLASRLLGGVADRLQGRRPPSPRLGAAQGRRADAPGKLEAPGLLARLARRIGVGDGS